ncbi:unnamed protein product [Nezara viridula]|uniref:Uncharacterized protein n=1 Tax=Nezara viridula TaxID=85310 RepID=A0A9P0EGX0_NEZVI|nr:unnamed protein product [Nezara viridula]
MKTPLLSRESELNESRIGMETLYTNRLHGFPNLTAGQFGPVPEEGVLSLVVVLATSVSLVALVFAFITYR